MRRIALAVALSLFCMATSGARAASIGVGSGVNQADVLIEFKDGAMYTFEVSFGSLPSDTRTGLDLFDVIEADTALYTVRQDFGFGEFIDGIYFDGHGNEGYGGGDDFWHYWTMESDDLVWTSSPVGASDRVVEDGDSDGWVYGRAGAPPEPGTVALLLIGVTIFVGRRG